MRKFFSFRSSSNNVNDSSRPPSIRKICSENPGPNDNRDLSNNSCEPSRDLDLNQSSTTGPHLRRSLSLSSASVSNGMGKEFLDSMSGSSSSSSSCCDKSSHHSTSHHCTSECLSKPRKWDPTTLEIKHLFMKTTPSIITPRSSSRCHCSSGVPQYSDPILLKGRSTCGSEISDRNSVLDLYIDREHQERRRTNGRQSHPSAVSANEHLAKKRIVAPSGRPPRALSTAPTSPASSKNNLRSHSFREVRDVHKSLSVQDWDASNFASSHEFLKKIPVRASCSLPKGATSKPPDYDSDATNKTEDIYEVSSPFQSGAKLIPHKFACYSCENLGSPRINDTMVSTKCSPLGYMSGKHLSETLPSSEELDQVDVDLLTDLKEAEERVQLTFVDIDREKLQSETIPTLLQMIKKLNKDRRNLALKLLTQVQCRVAEKAQTKNTQKNDIVELNSIVKRLEDEKNEMQTTLEKELDRRSIDWQEKLESFQAEEQRLRERVRELAEDNVFLQREVSLLRGGEVQSHERIMNLETQLNSLTTNLEEVERENQNLCQTISKLKECSSCAEADQDQARVSFKYKEQESKELEVIVLRLQKICYEQDKTISALRKQLKEELEEQPMERGDQISRLLVEQLRLTGVEQSLRKELESCMHEVQSIRHENVSLLGHLKSTSDGHGISLFRLDQELHSQVSFLRNLGLSLLVEISDLCANLLNYIKSEHFEQSKDGIGEFSDNAITEFFLQFQKLKGKVENMKRSLNTSKEIIAEKPHPNRSEYKSSAVELEPKQWKITKTEEDVEYELKMETLVTRVLKEKLCCKDLELEQLSEEISTMVRGREILHSEIARLQNELSNTIQNAEENELQMQRKDENLNQLRQECEGFIKELAVDRRTLTKVSEERDHLWEELKLSKENNMLLKYEVDSLKRKSEALDEDILVREGQIAILKDSLGSNSFGAISCHKSLS